MKNPNQVYVMVIAAGAALLAAWLVWGAGCCPATSNWTPEPSSTYTPSVYPTPMPTYTASPVPPTCTPIPTCRPEVTCSPTSPWDKPPATTTPYPPTSTPTPGPSLTPSPSPTGPTPRPIVLTLWAMDGTVYPTNTPTPPPPPDRPTPTPTMSAEEQAVVKEKQGDTWAASSPEGCWPILKEHSKCYLPTYAKRITHPEWEALFPGATFTLVEFEVYGRPEDNPHWPKRHNEVFAEQDYERIGLDGFERLLRYNNVWTITDENRELVARAFALMALPDYIEEEIVFSNLKEGSWPGRFGTDYNYEITAWTKIQGLRTYWVFLFHEGSLLRAAGYVAERNVGDYIDVPFEELPPYWNIEYWRKEW